MKLYALLMLVLLAGCTDKSYIKGCVDGAQMVLQDLGAQVPDEQILPYCQKLEKGRK